MNILIIAPPKEDSKTFLDLALPPRQVTLRGGFNSNGFPLKNKNTQYVVRADTELLEIRNMPLIKFLPRHCFMLPYLRELVLVGLNNLMTLPNMSGMRELSVCSFFNLYKMIALPGGLGRAPKLTKVKVQFCQHMRNMDDFVDKVIDAKRLIPLTCLQIKGSQLQVGEYLEKLTDLQDLAIEKTIILSGRKTRAKRNLDFECLYKIQKIRLHANSLKLFPNGVCLLPNLTSLSISHIPVNMLPREFSALDKLRYLFIGNMSLRELPSFSSFSKLETLVMDKLFSLEHLNDSIWALPVLENLHLHYMPVAHIHNDIGKLTSLSNLKLEEMPVKELPPGMCTLCNLTSFSLTDCTQCMTTNGVIGYMSKLVFLSIMFPPRVIWPDPAAHCTVFSEVAVSISGMKALSCLQIKGIPHMSEKVAMRAALCEPPPGLTAILMNEVFATFWNMVIPQGQDSLAYSRSMQKRSVAFASSQSRLREEFPASRKHSLSPHKSARVPTVPLLPNEIVQFICRLANGISSIALNATGGSA